MHASGSSTGGSSNTTDFDRFEVWKEYEKIATHFNELLMRLRTQSLAAVGAVAAVAGFVLKQKSGRRPHNVGES